MKTFSVNSNNDLFIKSSGILSISESESAVMQNCQTAVQVMLNEMVFAYDEGMPNFQTIWNSSPNLAQFESAFRTTVQNVTGVLGVSDFSASVQDNTLVYSATIKTIYGEAALNG